MGPDTSRVYAFAQVQMTSLVDAEHSNSPCTWGRGVERSGARLTVGADFRLSTGGVGEWIMGFVVGDGPGVSTEVGVLRWIVRRGG